MGFGPNILSMSLGARASKDMDLPHNISLILVKHLQSSVWLLLHINSSVTSDPSSSLLPCSYTCIPTNHITSPSLAYVHTYFHFLVSLVADSPIPIHIRLPMCDWAVRPFRFLPLLPDLSWNSILFQDYLVSSKAEHSALPAWVKVWFTYLLSLHICLLIKGDRQESPFKVWRSKGSVIPNVYFLPHKQPSVSPILSQEQEFLSPHS